MSAASPASQTVAGALWSTTSDEPILTTMRRAARRLAAGETISDRVRAGEGTARPCRAVCDATSGVYRPWKVSQLAGSPD